MTGLLILTSLLQRRLEMPVRAAQEDSSEQTKSKKPPSPRARARARPHPKNSKIRKCLKPTACQQKDRTRPALVLPRMQAAFRCSFEAGATRATLTMHQSHNVPPPFKNRSASQHILHTSKQNLDRQQTRNCSTTRFLFYSPI